MRGNDDFSKTERGKFYRPGAQSTFPVYLERGALVWLTARADAQGVAPGRLLNDILKKRIAAAGRDDFPVSGHGGGRRLPLRVCSADLDAEALVWLSGRAEEKRVDTGQIIGDLLADEMSADNIGLTAATG